ncbi:MAG: ABC transporter ATP-binding protein [Candidatus Omnitrophica bacterium]|nr:ABC transporter ATP-binding protein [Candidatus Omnitrophota bacterium]
MKEVYFSYLGRFPALCGIDAEILSGQKVAVVGANGSGKSTFLSLLDGLIFADKGEVRFLGRELNGRAFSDDNFLRDFRRKVGFVFQNPEVQLFCPTIKEDILFGPLQLGLDKAKTESCLERVSEMLGIGGLFERSPHQLSIGEKRKAALASVLVMDPEVLILDEPTAGLDPSTSRNIIDLLLDESSAGKTVVISTHDLHVVEEVAEEVYVLGQDRRVASCGKMRDILSDAALLAANNLTHIHSHRHGALSHTHSHLHCEQKGCRDGGLNKKG